MSMINCPNCEHRDFVQQSRSGQQMDGSSTTSASLVCRECGFSMRVYSPNDVDQHAKDILLGMINNYV